MVSEKTMFQFNDETSIWATLGERLKVNLDIWSLFVANVTLGLTYHVRIMTLAQ